MKLRMSTFILLAAAGQAKADAPHPDQVYIIEADHRGTGCAPGTVASNISDDREAITLLFDSFQTEAQGGPWGGSTRSHSGCTIDLKLHVPQGWSYALFNVDFRGYASISTRRGEVSQASRYSFGSRSLELGRTDITGPFDDDYESRRQAPIESLVWSECGEQKTLSITTDITAKARSMANAYITVDSIDGQFAQQYGIKWRPCNNPDDHRDEEDQFFTGRCQVVLETIWGTNLVDFWGQVDALDPEEAKRLSMDQARGQCEDRRGGGFLYKCSEIPSSCTAI